MRICFPSMQPVTLGKFLLSRNLTAMSKNLSRSVIVKCFDDSLLHRTSLNWCTIFATVWWSIRNEKAREQKDCPVEKYQRTKAFSFIKNNISNFTLYWLLYCCTDFIINLLNESQRVRKRFQGSKQPKKTHVVTLKYWKCMSCRSIAISTWRELLSGTQAQRRGKRWEICLFVCFWRDSPQWARASSFTRFLDHTQRRTTVGRTPLDEWSVRRRDLYLTTQNTHNRQKSMPPVGFEPTISAGERPQTYALDRAATGTGVERFVSGRNEKGYTIKNLAKQQGPHMNRNGNNSLRCRSWML